MPRFMLDTDTCSYIMKRSHPLVLKRLQLVPVSDVRMSVVTNSNCSTASRSHRGV
jgi:predicted nucleic acid-binding protein